MHIRNNCTVNYTIRILENLINIDTTKSRSNEIEAAEYIRTEFLKIGIKSAIYEPYPGKASIIAAIEGNDKDNIVLYSHLDTEEFMLDKGWKVRPDKASCENGKIFGRGSLDCKGLTAVWMGIIKKIAELKVRPQKSIVFIASCDEESGGQKGIKWLMDNTEYFKNTLLVLSEGGGYPVKSGKKTYFTVQTGEREKIVLKNNDDLYKLLLRKNDEDIFSYLHKGLISKAYNEQTVNYVKENIKNKDNKLRRIAVENFKDVIEEREDEKINLYKLPYIDDKEIMAKWNKNYEIIERVETGVIRDLTLYLNIIEKELLNIDSNYRILPFVTPGYSDNRYFRLNGISTIGFFPIDYRNSLSGIHGVNEYVSIDTIELSSNLLYKIIKNIAF
ncbi:Succinyl-diaminopimelate desuccinylase [anaerobic digester metagenome]